MCVVFLFSFPCTIMCVYNNNLDPFLASKDGTSALSCACITIILILFLPQRMAPILLGSLCRPGEATSESCSCRKNQDHCACLVKLLVDNNNLDPFLPQRMTPIILGSLCRQGEASSWSCSCQEGSRCRKNQEDTEPTRTHTSGYKRPDSTSDPWFDSSWERIS
jgi:hypothetical protein